MDQFLDWIHHYPQVFGFCVATVIFLFTVLLVATRKIGFFITLLFLLFALLSGIVVSNEDLIRDYFREGAEEKKTESNGSLSSFKKKLQDKYDKMKREWETEKQQLEKEAQKDQKQNKKHS